MLGTTLDSSSNTLPMPIDVIGAGFGRTGTYSLKMALETLLGSPCYHMAEVVGHHEDIDKWLDCNKVIMRGESFDFELIFSPPGRQAYRAACDHPAAAYYKDLLKQYPKAKIILTVRDSPEVWHKSALETIYSANKQNFGMKLAGYTHAPWLRHHLHMVDELIWSHPRLFKGGDFTDPEFATRYEGRAIAETTCDA
jgi:hypothetical protein